MGGFNTALTLFEAANGILGTIQDNKARNEANLLDAKEARAARVERLKRATAAARTSAAGRGASGASSDVLIADVSRDASRDQAFDDARQELVFEAKARQGQRSLLSEIDTRRRQLLGLL